MAEWWEREFLRFECQSGCVKCCVSPGVIYFDEEDIERAAVFLGVPVSAFKTDYLVREYGRWMIEVTENERCPFLAFNGCRIHDAKPRQCRTYPFWRENLATPKRWQATGQRCPGIGAGPAIPLKTIRDSAESDEPARENGWRP